MRVPFRKMRTFIVAIVAAAAAPALAQPTLTGRGDLPGGQNYSEARGVSGHGDTVVRASIINGHIIFGATYGAFAWTAGTGMVDIYSIGGIGTTCKAFASNAHGTVIVGQADYGVLT